ncbi:MAG: hypothetical protein EXS48_01065 [Candidatus Staskawiczbacteria bacterium]|nr:hypothetical protein [Candidatus Staskawiczbacteria bacterium]
MADEKCYQAIVQAVIKNGDHGPYAKATSDQLAKEIGAKQTIAITFSLDEKTWKEDEWPETGTYVVLSKVRKKRAGWRAQIGRFFKPSDEQTQGS